MTWKNLVAPFAIMSRRRALTRGVIYGLSLAVRFTSAAGDEMEIRPQPAQPTYPLISIMTRDRSHLTYLDWRVKPAQSIVFRDGWPPRSQAGCVVP